MNEKTYKTESLNEIFYASEARDFSEKEANEQNKMLYLDIWNNYIAPAIVEGKFYCEYKQSFSENAEDRAKIKTYFTSMGYVVELGEDFIKISW